MNPSSALFTALIAFVLLGCTQAPSLADAAETSKPATLGLARIIATADKMLLFEGLPHQGFEAKLLAEERKNKPTVDLHKFPFYKQTLPMKPADRRQLEAILGNPKTFKPFSGEKKCGGFHPDYAVEWQRGKDRYHVLLCFGCKEAKLVDPNGQHRKDLERAAFNQLKALLKNYRKNRPTKNFGAVPHPPAQHPVFLKTTGNVTFRNARQGSNKKAQTRLARQASVDPLAQWGQWRGPLSSGAAPKAKPPIKWGAKTNIRWKQPIPGLGHSTPIVWSDLVYLTTAEPFGDEMKVPKQPPGAHNNIDPKRRLRFKVLALHRSTGKIKWENTVHQAQPHQSTHESGTWASNSPVTDGRVVIASFGSSGIFGLDAKTGKPIWKSDLGKMQVKHGHGEGASPVIFGINVIVNWDHEGDSFVINLDKTTGKEIWRKERDEPTSWATPLIYVHEGKPQVIISATNAIRSYDLKTGKVIWSCEGMPNNVVASPVAADGILIAGASYVRRNMLAINLKTANGNLTDTDSILWRRRTGTPYVPSPLLHDGLLYFFHHYQNVLSIVDAKTGRDHGPYRLPLRSLYASPVTAAGHVYFTDLTGTTLVVTKGLKPEFKARNELNEPIAASPAIAGNEIYLRGRQNLYCIAKDNQ